MNPFKYVIDNLTEVNCKWNTSNYNNEIFWPHMGKKGRMSIMSILKTCIEKDFITHTNIKETANSNGSKFHEFVRVCRSCSKSHKYERMLNE